jgi:peptide/nickel transport system permease protein
MGRYLGQRAAAGLVALWGVSLILFFAVRLVPGDVVMERLQDALFVTPERLAEIRHELGLDVSPQVQYLRWVGGLVRGDLGESLWTSRPVLTELLTAIPISLELAVLGMFIAVLLAVPVGVVSATRPDGWLDYSGRLFSIGGLSIPDFVLGTLIVLYPAIWWGGPRRTDTSHPGRIRGSMSSRSSSRL